jgi:hypothetical protein
MEFFTLEKLKSTWGRDSQEMFVGNFEHCPASSHGFTVSNNLIDSQEWQGIDRYKQRLNTIYKN